MDLLRTRHTAAHEHHDMSTPTKSILSAKGRTAGGTARMKSSSHVCSMQNIPSVVSDALTTSNVAETVVCSVRARLTLNCDYRLPKPLPSSGHGQIRPRDFGPLHDRCQVYIPHINHSHIRIALSQAANFVVTHVCPQMRHRRFGQNQFENVRAARERLDVRVFGERGHERPASVTPPAWAPS